MIEEEESSGSKTGLFIGLAVAVVAGLAIYFGLQFLKPGPTAAPTAFTRFTAPDKSFVCESPTGWSTVSSSANGVASGARFEQGAARITVGSDLVGSLMGDVSRSLAGPQKPPVEKLHEMSRKSMEDSMKDYEEVGTQGFQSAIGDTRISEFTADGGWRVGKIHGVRLTMLGNERRINVICRCAEADWTTLKPTFIHVFSSIAPGQG